MCYILCMCVCGHASDMKTVSDDPSSSALCVVCTGRFPRGSLPPLVTHSAPKKISGWFFLF
jgi:hypothetical protein